MARLNEPVLSTDSIETLKRKFLRQNREIARINSTQSLKIRELENEVSRLLSENLTLRGRVIDLEGEIDTGNTHRIADHALDVKAQLEAQLSVFSSLIESLGKEPPRKRHSPSTRRLSKSRPSSTEQLARKLKEERQLEAAAQGELRLEVIPEHTPQPREPRTTLNSAEIRALRGDAEFNDSADSPDLGPPPVSRFVEDEPVKTSSPSPRPLTVQLISDTDKVVNHSKPATAPPVPKLDFAKNTTSTPLKEEVESEPSKKARSEASIPAPAPPKSSRAGGKRKFGDEADSFSILRQTDQPGKENALLGEARPLKEIPKQRSIKDLSTSKREAREKPVSSEAVSLGARKPLTAKSTNDSPRKVAQPTATDKAKPARSVYATDENTVQAPAKGTDKPANRSRKSVLVPIVQIPPPQSESPAPVPVASIPEPEVLLLEESEELTIPNTPDHNRSAPRQMACDTPPPAMGGDGARPSRRARPAISYAEPNLRDKMRRPTKELFDAVAGEGKFLKGRTSLAPAGPGTAQKSSSAEEPPRSAAASSSTSKRQLDSVTASSSEAAGMSAVEMAVAHEAGRRAAALSPTPSAAGREIPLVEEQQLLPSSITTQRRRRGSSMAPRESIAQVPAPAPSVEAPSSVAPLDYADNKTKEAPPAAAADEPDVYDFSSSSPSVAALSPEEVVKPAPKPRRARPSASFEPGGGGTLVSDVSGKSANSASGRAKRASMAAALTKLSMLDLEDTPTEESSLEGDAVFKERVSRRRSMML